MITTNVSMVVHPIVMDVRFSKEDPRKIDDVIMKCVKEWQEKNCQKK